MPANVGHSRRIKRCDEGATLFSVRVNGIVGCYAFIAIERQKYYLARRYDMGTHDASVG